MFVECIGLVSTRFDYSSLFLFFTMFAFFDSNCYRKVSPQPNAPHPTSLPPTSGPSDCLNKDMICMWCTWYCLLGLASPQYVEAPKELASFPLKMSVLPPLFGLQPTAVFKDVGALNRQGFLLIRYLPLGHFSIVLPRGSEEACRSALYIFQVITFTFTCIKFTCTYTVCLHVPPVFLAGVSARLWCAW